MHSIYSIQEDPISMLILVVLNSCSDNSNISAILGSLSDARFVSWICGFAFEYVFFVFLCVSWVWYTGKRSICK